MGVSHDFSTDSIQDRIADLFARFRPLPAHGGLPTARREYVEDDRFVDIVLREDSDLLTVQLGCLSDFSVSLICNFPASSIAEIDGTRESHSITITARTHEHGEAILAINQYGSVWVSVTGEAS